MGFVDAPSAAHPHQSEPATSPRSACCVVSPAPSGPSFAQSPADLATLSLHPPTGFQLSKRPNTPPEATLHHSAYLSASMAVAPFANPHQSPLIPPTLLGQLTILVSELETPPTSPPPLNFPPSAPMPQIGTIRPNYFAGDNQCPRIHPQTSNEDPSKILPCPP
ncbi:pectinesterase inhibitor 10-like [Cryptomeria japonica]|uniref:pectinesterase inhibitor 10-like n=1 Tax=Cryptomeria japonica TaxID=3369 RepID=UPI0027DA4E9C|nr:pectinesterase inhibitor 10-like [Cryptomeria japonica]